jgi:hypothetical protein
MSFRIGTNSVGMEHNNTNGNDVTGVLPPAPAPGDQLYVFDSTRAVAAAAELDATGLGLFDPHAYTSQKNVYCTHVYIGCDTGLAWTIDMTSGFEDGTPTTTVDDPVYDAPLATGTGPGVIRINQELLRKQKIRVTVASSTTNNTRIIAYFALVSGGGGRLIS